MSFPKPSTSLSLNSFDELSTKIQKDISGFEKLAALLKAKAGINLVTSDKNISLMASRLISILIKYKLNGYHQYLLFLSKGTSVHMTEFVSALTTNTTQFFREASHFDVLKAKLPGILESKAKQHHYELRIWCAAASTGQEVYTILMVLLEQIEDLRRWNLKFLATDIDPEVLATGLQGIYSEEAVQQVPQIQRQHYFDTIIKSPSEKMYQMKAEFRNMIRFAQFNLLLEQYPFEFPFDIIFCRNVLIYFDQPTCVQVIANLEKALSPGGLLFLGHSETGTMTSRGLKMFSHSAYQRVSK